MQVVSTTEMAVLPEILAYPHPLGVACAGVVVRVGTWTLAAWFLLELVQVIRIMVQGEEGAVGGMEGT